jgi:hypothetical protein
MIINIARMKRESKLLLATSFLILFILGGISPVHANTSPYGVMLTNTSDIAWGDFHFSIYEVPGFDIQNVAFNVTAPFKPLSSQTLDPGNEWTLINDQEIDLNFFHDPLMPGQLGLWVVNIDNPDGVVYGVTAYPSVVPEPVSSSLFIIGGATLGFRRFRKNRRVT